MVGESIGLNEEPPVHEQIHLANPIDDHPDIHLMASILELDAKTTLDQ